MGKRKAKLAATVAAGGLSSQDTASSSVDGGTTLGKSTSNTSSGTSALPTKRFLEERENKEALATLGLVDLRSTRPPPRAAASVLGQSPVKGPGGNVYKEITNVRELSDAPPPPKVHYTVDTDALKMKLEKKLFPDAGGADAPVKSKVMNANITEDGLTRMRAMLNNFVRLEDNTFMDDISLRQYGIDSGEIITNAVVQELCVVQPSLTRLDLTGCSLVTDVGLWAIARHCRQLKYLVLSGCDQITNVGLRSLSLTCTEMISLNFNHCHLLDDIGLTVVSTGCWKLEELFLHDCTGITDTGVGKLAKSGVHLKVLDLHGCSNVGEFGDHALREIGAFCGDLRYLDLGGCKRVEDPGLRAVAVGCPHLETLKIAGCEAITGTSLKALCKHSRALATLLLGGCQKLTDKDMEMFNGSAMQHTLTSLDILGCNKLTDRGVAAICHAVGSNLFTLGLYGSNVTDFSSTIISNFCTRLRSLDLSRCPLISDDTVHTCARRVTGLTTLKLDGDHKVTTRALFSYIGSALEFADMATKWLGYQPKHEVGALIERRERFRLHTKMALRIQSGIRRKFAYKVYWERRRWWLMNHIIPKFQARLRGVFQRKRYAKILQQIHRVRQAIKIQKRFRIFVDRQARIRKIKAIRFAEYKERMARVIQRMYKGMRGRARAQERRNHLAMVRLAEARFTARQEVCALIIQRNFTAWYGRRVSTERAAERERRRLRLALEERMRRVIQRVARGRLGRRRGAKRRWEIEFAILRWTKSIEIQRVARGIAGRKRYAEALRLHIIAVRNRAATQVQRIYRGYRGKILAAIARGLRILRLRQNKACIEIQRVMRGAMARDHVRHFRREMAFTRLRNKAVVHIQRLFRGHKGREARAVEQELRRMEKLAKPLMELIKRLEEDSMVQSREIARLEYIVKNSEEELFVIERELQMCMTTSSKYCDSSRINGMPQRFLTKYLRVRLKDHLDHERELHKARFAAMQKRRSQCRDHDKEIEAARRELLPLTTGLVSYVKKDRTKRLRVEVRRRKACAVKIQALWRRAIIRVAYNDPYRDYWIECLDLEQSEEPYYFNTWNQETAWKIPLSFKHFGKRMQEIRKATKERQAAEDNEEIPDWPDT